jgi:large subunit ribosomal protein L23
MRISNIVVRPIVTEKSFDQVTMDKYVFQVGLKAKKESIRKEIKRIYNVDAADINTIIMPGKKRRISGSRKFTKGPKWKKAIVKLKEGQSIDIFPKD